MQACRESTVSLAEAEQQVLEFVQQHAPEPATAQVRGGKLMARGRGGPAAGWGLPGAGIASLRMQACLLASSRPDCAPQNQTKPNAQIAGNSVHVDLAFLRKHMPRLVEHLHYRWARDWGSLGRPGRPGGGHGGACCCAHVQARGAGVLAQHPAPIFFQAGVHC